MSTGTADLFIAAHPFGAGLMRDCARRGIEPIDPGEGLTAVTCTASGW
ncbi:hypothetical protein [Amycolatopsis thailandensis]|nr:hypothetical protein [Amycolatopsis thailandensis]